MARLTLDGFRNFFTYYKAEPHQKEALELLWKAMPVTLLEEDASWVQAYRQGPPSNSNGIPQPAVDLIKEFEGFRSFPYDDGVGVATIGYGATFYENGRKVQFSDPAITEQEGEDLLKFHLEYFWGVQESTIPFWEEMTDGQRGCLLSFSFNCGANFYGSSGFNTITGCLKDKRWDDVPSALMLYVNPGSAVEAGLKRRRQAEIELWLS